MGSGEGGGKVGFISLEKSSDKSFVAVDGSTVIVRNGTGGTHTHTHAYTLTE